MDRKNRYQLLTAGLVVIMSFLVPGGIAEAEVPNPFICMYGHSDNAGFTDHFRTFIPPFTVIEGTSSDADFIKELRADGKVYAAHVTNPETETTAQLVARWRAPFDNNLGGQLPGGYDAVAIDELRSNANGTTQSNRICQALAQLRSLYPTKQIYVAATWHLGSDSSTYSDQLNAVNDYADMFMIECYIREGNPSYGWLTQWADNLKNTVPGILNKTVYGLWIPQGGLVADDTTYIGFWGHLDEQFHRIKNDADAASMPGVMLWPYYRTEKDLTPDYCARLIDHYYTNGNTSYYGDGSNGQLVSNPRFESSTSGWALTPGSGGSIARFSYSSVSFENNHDDWDLSSHGSYGLKMTRGSGTNKASYQQTGLDADKAYTVSAFVISDSGTNNKARITITQADGTYIESKAITNVGSPPDWLWKWNEWSRIIFHFVPTSSTIKVVLSDENASTGQILYWDFVELEDAFTAATDFEGDFEPDGDVDVNDLAVLMANWLQGFGVPLEGLVGYWPLDDDANDYSGYDNRGTFVGDADIITDSRGKVLNLDGNADYVEVSDDPVLSPPTITLAAWIYPDDVSHDFQIIGKWGSGDAEYIFDNISNNDGLRLGAAFGGTWDVLNSSDAVLTAGTWQHVAVTWDGSSAVFYVNGSSAGQDNSASGDLPDSNNDVTIGAKYDGTRGFDGMMDSICIYNRALSAEEIQQLSQVTGDINNDGVVNFPDYVIFANNWLAGTTP